MENLSAQIKILDLDLEIEIGNYDDGDVVPERHIIDLTFSIDPTRVLIEKDQMNQVFDYDPLLREIKRLAAEKHYETQERFITRVVDECINHDEITSIDVFLRKFPIFSSTGELGVRLQINEPNLTRRRAKD